MGQTAEDGAPANSKNLMEGHSGVMNGKRTDCYAILGCLSMILGKLSRNSRSLFFRDAFATVELVDAVLQHGRPFVSLRLVLVTRADWHSSSDSVKSPMTQMQHDGCPEAKA